MPAPLWRSRSSWARARVREVARRQVAVGEDDRRDDRRSGEADAPCNPQHQRPAPVALRSADRRASPPPIRPPMWPPIEMPEIDSVSTRLRTIVPPMPDCHGSMPRWRSSMKAAPSRPKIAPDAPTVSLNGLNSSAPERTGEQADEVDRHEPDATDRRLEHRPTKYRTSMFEPMCRKSKCRKPPSAAGSTGAAGRHTARAAKQWVSGQERCRRQWTPEPVACRPAALGQESEDVDHDQRLGRAPALVAHRAHRHAPWSSGSRTQGSACRRASASCSRGRSGDRSSSTRRRSRAEGCR